MITKETVQENGFNITDNFSHAIYVLACGSLIDGEVQDGYRTEDHRMAEAFSEYDRYDGQTFWEDVTVSMGMILIVPETRTVLLHPNYHPTMPQIKALSTFQNMGYKIEDFK